MHPFFLFLVLSVLSFLSHAQASDIVPSKAVAWLEQAEQAAQQGDYETEIRAWTAAIALFQGAGNRLGLGTAYLRRGEARLAAGYFDAAISDLEQAHSIELSGGQQDRIAAVKASLGDGYFVTGDRARARDLLEQARAIARNTGNPQTEAVALNNLANLNAVEQQIDSARERYAQAQQIAQNAQSMLLSANILVNHARLELDAGNQQTAARFVEQALNLLQKQPAHHDIAFLLLTIARLQQDIGTEKPAYQTLEQARVMAEGLQDQRVLSLAYGYLSELYGAAERYPEALQLNARAVFHAQNIDAADLLYQGYWQNGRWQRAQGDLDAAIAAHRRATHEVERIRTDLLVGYRGENSAFRAVLSPLYTELVDLLLQRAAAAESGTAEQVDLLAARDTVESLKAAELQDYFLDPCVTRAQTQASKPERLAQFAPNSAVLYPIILPNRIELLLDLPSGMRRQTATVTLPQVLSAGHELRALLEKRTTYQYLPYAQRLYDWLLRPLETMLSAEDIHTLIVVPDGPLRTIPFATLHDGRQYLIARYAVVTTPGMSLTDAAPPASNESRILISGLSEAVQGFPPLPAVPRELAAIQNIFGPGNGLLLQNSTFIPMNLEQALTTRPYNVVHIASHGQFERDTRNSFLLTYRGKINMNQLEEFMQLRRFSEQPIELLTLSACQTAAGDDRAALGLAGVAIKAGARSALGTLWFVNDEASAILVADFYHHLHEGETKAASLRQAQLGLLNDRRYRHPGYWSPFLMIGNWL